MFGSDFDLYGIPLTWLVHLRDWIAE